MIGPGGIGKSEFWAEGEKTLFLELEPRLDHLAVLKVPVRSFVEAEEAVTLLYKQAQSGLPYDTIIVDTIDKLVERIHEDVIDWANDKYRKVLEKTGMSIETIGDIPEGNGWARSTTLLNFWLDKLTQLPAATVLIGHTKTVQVKEGQTSYDKETISIGGQTGTKLLYWSDHTLHVRAKMVGDEVRRMLRTIPSQTIEAKSSGGIVPDGMVWGKSAKDNYAGFRQLFD